MPDGICLDAEGAIWSACPLTGRVLRVREGGEVTDEVTVSRNGAYACMLGGADRRDAVHLRGRRERSRRRPATMRGAIETCDGRRPRRRPAVAVAVTSGRARAR